MPPTEKEEACKGGAARHLSEKVKREDEEEAQKLKEARRKVEARLAGTAPVSAFFRVRP